MIKLFTNIDTMSTGGTLSEGKGDDLKEHAVDTQEKLLALVGESCTDKYTRGPVMVRAVLWDGREVIAMYCPSGQPDAATREPGFQNLEPLRHLVDRLLASGKPFITSTGADDEVCVLEWKFA